MNLSRMTLTALGLTIGLAATALPVFAASDAALSGSSACDVPNAPAKALTQVAADWPAAMPLTYVDSEAIVQIDVDANGVVSNPRIVRSTGFTPLDRSAQQAALAQRFAPEVRDCQAVAGTYLYAVDFPAEAPHL